MLSGPELAAWLEDAIRHAYQRPKMYAQSPGELETVLHYFHLLFLTVHERARHLPDAISSVCDNTVMLFGDIYRSEHPQAGEDEVFQYVVSQWKLVSEHLGIETEEPKNGDAAGPVSAAEKPQATIQTIETTISGSSPHLRDLGMQLYLAEGGQWGEIRRRDGELVLELLPLTTGPLIFRLAEIQQAFQRAEDWLSDK